MSNRPNTLVARQTDLTLRLILDAAVALTVEAPGEPLSMRATAKRAGMSERTVFRYFATREDLLDATTREVQSRLNLPSPPTSLEELVAYPKALYAAFEAQAALIVASLPSDVAVRLRQSAVHDRRRSLAKLIDRLAPDRPLAERRVATANLYFHLVASTWHYYRFHIGFQPKEAVRSAEVILGQTLRGLGVEDGGPSFHR